MCSFFEIDRNSREQTVERVLEVYLGQTSLSSNFLFQFGKKSVLIRTFPSVYEENFQEFTGIYTFFLIVKVSIYSPFDEIEEFLVGVDPQWKKIYHGERTCSDIIG